MLEVDAEMIEISVAFSMTGEYCERRELRAARLGAID